MIEMDVLLIGPLDVYRIGTDKTLPYNQDMRDKILSKVEECFLIAEKFYGKSFPRPTEIIFKRNGTTAGYCRINGSKTIRELMFQLDLAEDNPDDFINQIVPHELSHYIQFYHYGFNLTPHGREWKYVMRNVYRLNPDRCHSYDINVTKVKRQTRHEYKCPCRTFKLTTTMHNKIQRGEYRSCLSCGQRLVLVAEGDEIQQKIERVKLQIEALKKRESLNTAV